METNYQLSNTSKRLEILKSSLTKKNELFDTSIQDHFDTVKATNGQPLNDKRNGHKTFKKWDKQNEQLNKQLESIQRTKEAIEKEEIKIRLSQEAKKQFPPIVVEMLKEGILNQWRKHPNILFVVGVDHARIQFLPEKNMFAHKYTNKITDQKQRKKFKDVYELINSKLST